MDLPYVIPLNTTTFLNPTTLNPASLTVANQGAVAVKVIGDAAAQRLVTTSTSTAGPTLGTRSTGTRFVLGLRSAGATFDHALGVGAGDLQWITSPGAIQWYVGNNLAPALRLSDPGVLEARTLRSLVTETSDIITASVAVASVGTLRDLAGSLHLDVPQGVQLGTGATYDESTGALSARSLTATTSDVTAPRLVSSYTGAESDPVLNAVTPGTRVTLKPTTAPGDAHIALGTNGSNAWWSIPNLSNRWTLFAGTTAVLSVTSGTTQVRDRTLSALRPIDVGPYDVALRTYTTPGTQTIQPLALFPAVPFADPTVTHWTLDLQLRGTHHRRWEYTATWQGIKRGTSWVVSTRSRPQGTLHGLMDRVEVVVNGTDLDLHLPLLQSSGSTRVIVSEFRVY